MEACCEHRECDLLVVGAGPAGLAAAINAASEGLSVVVLDRGSEVGGQARESSRIENYLGFADGLDGPTFAEQARGQAIRFGVDIHVEAEVIDVRPNGNGGHQIMCDSGNTYSCRVVLIASGVTYRRLDVPGIDPLIGRGVFYGLNPSQAEEFRGARVFIVGGANSAGQCALHLSQHGAEVHVLSRSPLAKSMSSYLVERFPEAGITVHEGARVAATRGNGKLTHVTVADAATIRTELADGLLVFIGAEPRTSWAPVVDTDGRGFILTGPDVPIWGDSAQPLYLETSVPGIFAAGDVRAGSVKRVAAAAGEGAMAVQFIHKRLAV